MGGVGGEGSDSFPSSVFEDQQREAARHRFDLNALSDCKFMLNHRLLSVSSSSCFLFNGMWCKNVQKSYGKCDDWPAAAPGCK